MNKRVIANGKRSKPQQQRPDVTRSPESRSERVVESDDEDEHVWTPQEGGQLYQIHGWGSPYFSVADNGHVVVTPDPLKPQTVDLHELVNNLRARGLGLPLLIRFPDILGDRIRQINEAFEAAIKDYNYPAHYQGVFPVKVNQQRHLVEDIVQRGEPWRFGLEAGSKPELMIALAMSQHEGSLIVCNGYKDAAFMETAFVAQQFDKTVVVVLERMEELDLALKAAEKLGVKPSLGVRAKLAAKGVGRWKDSAGERAKFGLTKAEVIEVVDRLAQRNMLDCLKLLHFHIGSQISSIMPIKSAVQEAAIIYSELAKMGCGVKYLDVGGGLAIDYDGSQTDFHASRNYSLNEYAADVVSGIQDVCTKAGSPMPIIVTERGRATAADQSCLIFDVVGVNEVRFGEPQEPGPEAHRLLRDLYDTWRNVLPKNVQESYHDASQLKEEAQSLFKYGYLGLRELAQAEKLFWNCCEKILDTMSRLKFVPEELHALELTMSSIYYCNFSVFQSAPDTWAIDQLFPVMPIHRLEERPTVRATLADLTCDSDGMLDHFIDVEEDASRTLAVHPLKDGEPYYLGMFLNGAYQEILGDLHNLFGDTNAVHVRLTEEGYEIDQVIRGDRMSDVLRYVQYSPDVMIDSVRRQAERALSRGRITVEQMRLLMNHYEGSMLAYTYLSEGE
ncbi:MAG: biosynthetic arginine decarboxylase [Myxococcales bacterium]|nr:biosynthetic arginine decarboxylase [Myxococcales bacterium]